MSDKKVLDTQKSITIDDLTIEDNTDRVSLFGSLNLSRDQVGLSQAKVLRDVLNQLIGELEAQADLPERLQVLQPKMVKNPFQ